MIKLLSFPFKFPQLLSKLFSPFRTITHLLLSDCNRGVFVRPAIHVSQFAFHECFSRNTQWNIKHSLYTFRISCEFRVLLMPQKNKPQNHLSFRANANPGVKCCEMQKAKKGAQNVKKVAQNTPLYTFRFLLFPSIFAYFAISV